MGAPSRGVWIKDTAKDLKHLMDCQRENYITVLSSTPNNLPKGILADHAYALINVFHEEQPPLLKIRNPWGNYEWEGEYRDKSNKWNSNLK